MSIENRQFEIFSSDPVGGSSSGGGEGQKLADFGQTAGMPDWGVPGEIASNLGGLILENSQRDLFPEVPFARSEQPPLDDLQVPASDIKEARRAVWKTTGYVLPIVGGTHTPEEHDTPSNSPEKRHQSSEDSDTSEPEEQQFFWDRDLSPNAQALYKCILGDVCTPDFLDYLEREHSIDVQAGLEELDSFNQVDYRDDTTIRLRWVTEAGRL